MVRTIVFVLALFPMAANAQDLTDFRRVLLPVTASLDGAGVRFVTKAQTFSSVDCTYFPAAETDSGLGIFGPLPPHQKNSQRWIFLRRPISPAGAEPRFLFIARSCYDQIGLSLTVFSNGHRTRIPVVRDDQFRSGPMQILDVPADWTWPPVGNCDFACTQDPVYRHTLRVVAGSGPGAEVIVRVWSDSGAGSFGPGVRTHTLRLDRRDGPDPSFPSYGELDIPNHCYHARGACSPATGVRVEIVAEGGLRYWAYVSSTENDTGRVLISAPFQASAD